VGVTKEKCLEYLDINIITKLVINLENGLLLKFHQKVFV